MSSRPEPAGFGNCPECAYAGPGTARICFGCASETMETLPPNRCDYCELELKADGSCGNPVCNWPEDRRFFTFVWAISMRTGELERAINLYKFREVKGWAWIFGRVLVGYLNANAAWASEYDLIVPSPTYVGADGRSFDHTGKVIERASIEDQDDRWPFQEEGIIVKTRKTTAFHSVPRWQDRRRIAEEEIRAALHVPRPEVVRGRRVLVYDDVFTDGLTLREVARALKQAGASEVSEVVLARQPWRG